MKLLVLSCNTLNENVYIEGTKFEDTDDIVLDVLYNDTDLNILYTGFDYSHRSGNRKIQKKSGPIIVKFVRYYDRRNVFINKKCSKCNN